MDSLLANIVQQHMRLCVFVLIARMDDSADAKSTPMVSSSTRGLEETTRTTPDHVADETMNKFKADVISLTVLRITTWVIRRTIL